ncbi:KH domain-containing protein [bacterium]|nr:KH domain-containing protein [bacterium]
MSAEPKETLELLLHHLGFAASVEEQATEDGVLLNIKTEDSNRLIGRGGQILADLQYLTNRLLFQQNPDAPKVTIDIDGYRAKAQEALIKKAQDAAEKVHRWGNVVELEPMSSFDRRIVHNALKDHPHVTTESVEVEGTNKKVILLRPRPA